jgi:hypothetical protein
MELKALAWWCQLEFRVIVFDKHIICSLPLITKVFKISENFKNDRMIKSMTPIKFHLSVFYYFRYMDPNPPRA